MRVHNRPPQTIITDEQQSIASAISVLQDRGFYPGVHIYDPWHIMKNLRKKLVGSDEWQRDIMKVFKTAIYSRSDWEYVRAFRTLADNNRNFQTINKFIEKAHKINYFDIPMTFLGIHRFSCDKINDLIKSQVPNETTILQFFKKIRSLDDIIT
jgi:hypothetical protein